MDWMLYFPLLEARSRWRLRRGELALAQADALELAARAEQSGELNFAVFARALLARCAFARGEVEASLHELESVAPRVADAALALPEWLAAAQVVVAHDSKQAQPLLTRVEALRRGFESRAGADADPLYAAWHAAAVARLAPASHTGVRTKAAAPRAPRNARRR